MIIVATIVLVTVSICESSIGYVKPDNYSGTCPASPCEVLDYYATNSSLLADSHVLTFLHGIHIMNYNFVITNLTSIVLTVANTSVIPGSSKYVVIKCAQTAGIIFVNVFTLTLRGLTFQYCGYNYTSEFWSALYLENIMGLELFAVQVWNSSGFGVVAKNTFGIIHESTFLHNRGVVTHNGGNAYVEYSACPAFTTRLCLKIVSSNFSHGQNIYQTAINPLASGLSVVFKSSCANLDIFLYNVTMDGNHNSISNGIGGNMVIHFFNSPLSEYVHISGSRFINGEAAFGGGIGVTVHHNMTYQAPIPRCYENFVYVTNSDVSHNSGVNGCGLYVEVMFEVIDTSCTKDIISLKNVSLINNQAKHSDSIGHNIGVAIFIQSGYFNEELLPIRINLNTITVEGSTTNPLYSVSADSAAILIQMFLGQVTIMNSDITDNKVSGISLIKSKVIFYGNNLISNNSGINGGGLLLCGSSYIELTPKVKITLTANTAATFGGAIYSRASCRDSHPTCFYHVWTPNSSNVEPKYLIQTYNHSFLMKNNMAGIAGQDIYGNAANCHFYRSDLHFHVTHDIFYKIFRVQRNTQHGHFSAVTSDPIRVCVCEDGTFNCTIRRQHYSTTVVYPGQIIHVPVVLVGQLDGTVPGTLVINGVSQVNINTSEKCSLLPITLLHNTKTYVVVSLYTSFSIKKYLYPLPNDTSLLIIEVNIANCPIGFILQDQVCICNGINTGIDHCNISKSTITTGYGVWIGYSNINNNKYVEGIIYHKFCPLNYCNDIVNSISVNGSTINADMQCSQYRTGLLCGACQDNYSVVVGSTKCVDCRNKPKLYALLVTVLLDLASTIVILLLGAFKISVTDGTLAGLLFYANILYASKSLFRFTDINILTVFIAILNLDTGIGSCFYNGMDTYAKTWFQLLIPVFLWMEILGIILVSRRSDRVARFVGDSAAKMLATLIELSFNRALRACISSLSFTGVEFPSHNGTKVTRYVWLYDANIDYLKGKHIPLFLAGGLVSVFLVAYTSVLLFVQPLLRYSHVYCCGWVNRLKPLIDAYTAPNVIKSRCRFWGGLLLLSRIVLSVSSAFNINNQPDNDLVSIILVCFILSVVVFAIGGIYKCVVLNAWNATFILNLGLLSTATAFMCGKTHSAGHLRNPQLILIVVDTSAGLVFLMFVGLIIYYIIKRYLNAFKKICKKVQKVFKRKPEVQNSNPEAQDSNPLLHVSQDSVCHARLTD